MEEVKFYVRCYDKIELARMYFPNLSICSKATSLDA